MLSCLQLNDFICLTLICRNSVHQNNAHWNSVPSPFKLYYRYDSAGLSTDITVRQTDAAFTGRFVSGSTAPTAARRSEGRRLEDAGLIYILLRSNTQSSSLTHSLSIAT